MHVRKFEGESLEEVIRQVKSELGPDAIILKTKTNKGLSGAFKKGKIEITAAISERSYVSKANVDKVLDKTNKERFYSNSSEKIKESINKFNNPYEHLALNKTVKRNDTQTKLEVQKQSSVNLDAFLTQSTKNDEAIKSSSVQLHQFINEYDEPTSEEEIATARSSYIEQPQRTTQFDYSNQLQKQEQKIQDLEYKLASFMQDMTLNRQNSGPAGIEELKTTLKTLDLNARVIAKLVKKICAQLSAEDLENSDLVFDLALKELNDSINVKRARFSEESNGATITLFISEGASGQTTCIRKIASLASNSLILKFGDKNTSEERVDKLLDISTENVSSISEVIGHCRRNQDNDISIFIDLNVNCLKKENAKEIIENLTKNFSNVEVLLNVSAIHSEIYNRKIISKYCNFLNGIIINHIDMCLNFGALINVHDEFKKLPLVFFGIGRVIPEDIEAATSERLLGSLFKL